jgi:hypothetical protein
MDTIVLCVLTWEATMRGENKAYGGALLAHLGFGVYCYDRDSRIRATNFALALGAVLEVEHNTYTSLSNQHPPSLLVSPQLAYLLIH